MDVIAGRLCDRPVDDGARPLGEVIPDAPSAPGQVTLDLPRGGGNAEFEVAKVGQVPDSGHGQVIIMRGGCHAPHRRTTLAGMADTIEITSTATPLQGLLAVPDSGSGPGVIVIQEWWGLVPQIESVVDRFAAAGFVALAPDHYRGERTTEPDEAGKLMMGLKVAAAASDIAASADHLVRSGMLPIDRVGVVGFCMGGGLALLAPTVSPHIDCASAFYPAMPWPDYHPDWANYTGREALIHQAESDIPSTGQRIAEYAAAIGDNGGTVTIVDYPGSQHAFFNEDRSEVYDATAAGMAWGRTVEMFHRRLSGPFA